MFGDYRKVKCKDGSVVFVLKDLGKAFSVHAPSIDFNLKTALNTSQQMLSPEVKVKLKKEVEQIFEKLDAIHIDAMQKFIMAYNVFMIDPCNKKSAQFLTETVEKIQKSSDELRELVIEVNNLNEHRNSDSTIITSITKKINAHIANLRTYYQTV
jgi:reverse gyrase